MAKDKMPKGMMPPMMKEKDMPHKGKSMPKKMSKGGKC